MLVNKFKKLGLAVAISSATAATPGLAQEIEEIVVTARFQEESLQQIPLAITAISADKLVPMVRRMSLMWLTGNPM